jgi:hypothetical protein
MSAMTAAFLGTGWARRGHCRHRRARFVPAIDKRWALCPQLPHQLGRIGDALIVLLKDVELAGTLSPEEEDAIRDLKSMLNEITNKKIGLVIAPGGMTAGRWSAWLMTSFPHRAAA